MGVEGLVTVKRKTIHKQTVLFMPLVRTWCTLPYPDHPKGCMNYDSSPLCPPQAPYRVDLLEKYNYVELVIATFEFGKYIERMKLEHKGDPFWTEKRMKAVIYWQHSVKKIMKEYINSYSYDEILGSGSGFGSGIQSMESAGIHVFATCKRNGITLDVKCFPIIRLITALWSNTPCKRKKNIQESLEIYIR